jgi:N-acetylglutamate synthase-like GNAT family acetyltransferase
MPPLELRIATPGDARAVSGVLQASYSTLYRGWYGDAVLDRALPAMTRANPLLLASGRYFVVEFDRKVVACGGWSAERPTGGRIPRLAHLRHFATHPDYINRGCGAAVISRCLGEARAERFEEMEVISSLTAEAFYARHGFRQLAVVQQPMGGADFACMLMRRSLETRQ